MCLVGRVKPGRCSGNGTYLVDASRASDPGISGARTADAQSDMLKRLARILRGLGNPAKRREGRFTLLRWLGRWLAPGYRFHWQAMAWWQDQGFNEYLKRFHEFGGMNTDRRWISYQLTRLAANIPGDTAECGVYEGATSFLICRSLQGGSNGPRTHFLFDSFEGLSAPSVQDGTHWKRGDLAVGLEAAKANLQAVGNLSWHPGWIPDRFEEAKERKFSFVHIDVDLYQPTRDSIAFFYPRMNDGGIIVCDDYGFTTCPGATLAMDEFLADKPEKVVSLPCGGGFLVKGCRTAPPLAL